MTELTQHLESVQPLLHRWGYTAVFVAIFVEGCGIPAPGRTLLIAAALLAAKGDLWLGLLLATAVYAAAGGNLAGYAIGRVGGHRVLERIASPQRLAQMKDLFERRGGTVVGFGRFVDGLRQLSGIAAGSLDMDLATFFAWNLGGAVVWVAFWGGGAFLFERHVTELSAVLHHLRPLALGLAAIGVLVALRWLRRAPDADPPASPDATR
jgi:membrane protein DedA with SNARE-associated domain